MSAASPSTVAAVSMRGWFRRNWKWFIPSMFLAAVVLGAIAVFGYVQVRSYRYRSNPAYQAALAAVQESPRVRDRLGQPIADTDWNPQGDIDVSEGATIGGATFNFTVSGPNGSADVATDGRMVNGQWALTRLELRFPDGDRLSLTKEIEAKQKVDTPAFDPDAEKRRQSKTADAAQDATAREVTVDVPDVPPGVK